MFGFLILGVLATLGIIVIPTPLHWDHPELFFDWGAP